MTKHPLSDSELDRLLAIASHPVPPVDAKERLLAAVASSAGQQDNVIAFRPRTTKPGAQLRGGLAWISALPLAASLAAGIWLGAIGLGTQYLPESLGGGSVVAADDAIFSGIDDVEILSEDNQV